MSLILSGVAVIIGLLGGYTLRKTVAKGQLDSVETKVEKLLDDAKIQAKEIKVNAKDKAVEILEQAKHEEQKQRDDLRQIERRLESKERTLDQKHSQSDREKKVLTEKANEIKKIREDVLKVKEQQMQRLERIAQVSKEDAKKILLQMAEKESKDDLVKKITQLEQDKREQLEAKAKNIMTLAMQRYAGSHAADTTTTTVSIPSDDIKGRIIGREGRNIKALERLTGAEIIVDDTPEAIVVSGFDPMRREIAKLAVELLIDDGRIHPTRIEESVEKAKQEIGKKIKEAGEAAIYDVGIAGIDPKLVQLLGRLRYRTSYGQNVLLHSLEVAHLSGALAAELGEDVMMAKKAGLLHDIGKSVDHEIQGTHVELGVNILKKFHQPQEVIEAVQSHHEDYPFTTNLCLIVAAADAISASRPGARKDTLENYLKRLEDLEKVAMSFEGVEKCYAVQAGREVRIFVNPEKIDDLESLKLAQRIAQRIEEELNYPGEIKVNVLRETRAVEYAR